MGQSAQTKARTLLAQKYTDEVRELYLKEKAMTDRSLYKKASQRNSAARSRALSKLIANHFMEYTVLYELCVMDGFPRQSVRGATAHG